MEGASGAKYTDYMRQNVIVPAGMDHTQVDDRFAIIPYRTRFYQETESRRRARTRTSSTPATRFPAAAGSRPPKTWRNSKLPY